MKRTSIVAALSALVFSLVVLAAIPQAPAPLPTRIAMGGKAVALVADAVYLFPAARDRVIAVGKADQGLGEFLAAIDPSFASKASLDRAAGAEAYAALKPDLCVFKTSMRSTIEAPLKALGIPTLFLSLESPEDYANELRILGQVFGDPARAEALVSYYANAVSSVAAAASKAPASERPRVLVLQVSGDSWEVPPDGWLQTRLVETAGGVPVWKGSNPGAGWARVGFEQVAAWNPDRIYVVSYKERSDVVAAALAADPRVAGLKAAKSGDVRGVPQDFYSWDQSDPRWVLGLYWYAKRSLPSRFASISIEKEARRFFAFAWGLDDRAFDATIKPRLAGDWKD